MIFAALSGALYFFDRIEMTDKNQLHVLQKFYNMNQKKGHYFKSTIVIQFSNSISVRHPCIVSGGKPCDFLVNCVKGLQRYENSGDYISISCKKLMQSTQIKYYEMFHKFRIFLRVSSTDI